MRGFQGLRSPRGLKFSGFLDQASLGLGQSGSNEGLGPDISPGGDCLTQDIEDDGGQTGPMAGPNLATAGPPLIPLMFSLSNSGTESLLSWMSNMMLLYGLDGRSSMLLSTCLPQLEAGQIEPGPTF